MKYGYINDKINAVAHFCVIEIATFQVEMLDNGI